MTKIPHIVVEIVNSDGSVVVCDTLAYLVTCDDGLADEADDIIAAIDRGEFYTIGGGAAECFTIQPAPQAAWQFYAA